MANEKIDVFASAVKYEEKLLEIRENRLNRLKAINAPRYVIDREYKLINESKQNIAVLTGNV